MSINLDDICYKKNYITEAIARVDFLNSIEELNEKLPLTSSSKLRKSFPITEKDEKIAHNVKFGPEGSSVSNVLNGIEWTLWNKEKKKKIVLEKDYFLFVDYSYTSSKDFLSTFEEAFNEFSELFPQLLSKRFGIRYINNIKMEEPDPLDWTAYIDSKLTASLDIPDDKALLARSFHEQALTFDDYNFIFRFGIHNSDYPARIKKKNFILDLDTYSSDVLTPTEVIDKSLTFHRQIQSTFESSITDTFREVLNAE